MGGEFFFKVKHVFSVTEPEWQGALFDVLVDIDRIFDGDASDAFICLDCDADRAFLFRDEYASWADGKQKSFELSYKWGKGAIKSNLGGRRRGDWSIVRHVCEELCKKLPGKFALVVCDGFSGYNDDAGGIYFDGTPGGYKRLNYREWPWV